jgi:predicted acetyltransferase
MGVGKEVSMRIFDMFPGGCEISQWTKNLPAQRFWGKVVDEYTNGKYNTFNSVEKNEVGFTFDNSLQAL